MSKPSLKTKFLLFVSILYPFVSIALLYWPFFDFKFGGGWDSEYHILRAHDIIQQLKQGIWVPWVSQTEIAFNGQSHYHDPMHTLLYTFLYYVWPFDLDGLKVSYIGTVLVGFFSFVLARQFTFSLSKSRFWSNVFASIYACCPALLAQIYVDGHFPTQLSWLWAPGIFYYLTKICRGMASKRDLVLLALFLAAILFSHPVIAAWAYLSVAIFAFTYWFFAKGTKPTLSLLCSGVLTALFLAPHLTFLFSQKGSYTATKLGGNTCKQFGHSPNTDQLITQAHEIGWHVLEPLYSKIHWIHMYQPGFALILITLLSLFLFFKREKDNALKIAGISTLAFLCIAAFGFGLEKIFWRALPCSLSKITVFYYQRVYIPLAALSLVLLASMIPKNPVLFNRKWIKGLALLSIGWSFYQTQFLIEPFYKSQKLLGANSQQYLDANTSRQFNWANTGRALFHLSMDGALLNRFLDSEMKPLSGNLKHLLERCKNDSTELEFSPCHEKECSTDSLVAPKTQTAYGYEQLLVLNFTQNNCHDIEIVNPHTFLSFTSSPFEDEHVLLRLKATDSSKIYIKMKKDAPPNCEEATLQNYCLVSYQRQSLPIAIEEFAPYKARLNNIPENTAFLETHRMFLDLYQAQVDGGPRASVSSPSGHLSVPISSEDQEVAIETKYPWWYHLGWILFFSSFLAIAALWVFERLGSKSKK